MDIVDSSKSANYAKVDNNGILMVGLDGFTIEDLAKHYPGVSVAIHVKDGDDWVPVRMEEVKRLRECEADAKRMRWLLDGNGYFMEDSYLCSGAIFDEEDKRKARQMIDSEMEAAQ